MQADSTTPEAESLHVYCTWVSAMVCKLLIIKWRRGSGSNRRIKVLQTFALPLGYRAVRVGLLAKYRALPRQVKLRRRSKLYATASPCSVPHTLTAIPISANIAAFAASARFAPAASGAYAT